MEEKAKRKIEIAKELEEKRKILFSIYDDADDPHMKEYLNNMKSKTKARTWMNEESDLNDGKIKAKVNLSVVKSRKTGGENVELSKVHVVFDGEADDDEFYQELPSLESSKAESVSDEVSDLDYLKSKMKSKESLEVDEVKDSTSEDEVKNDPVSIKSAVSNLDSPRSLILDSGRLFVRNLSFLTTEEELKALFEEFGPVSEVHIPITKDTKQPKGFAYVLFMIPENAFTAFRTLDGKIFQGRLLHVLPAEEKVIKDTEESNDFKSKKEQRLKKVSSTGANWNSLFMSSDAVVESMASQLSVKKSDILDPESDNLATRIALAETHIINDTKAFLKEHGINLDAFKKGKIERSKTLILIKNIPFDTELVELQKLFGAHGSLERVLIPPTKTIAMVEFMEPAEARSAFKSLAYSKFKHVPLYLEWAPIGLMDAKTRDSKVEPVTLPTQEIEPDIEESEISTVFVKNLNFDTREEGLRRVFGHIPSLKSVKVATKKDPKRVGEVLSMGYGFLEFSNSHDATMVVKTMQKVELDSHALELKISNRKEKSIKVRSKTKTKLIVRNIPFEAQEKEIRELFKSFGQLKRVRLPRKFDGTHRGFGFVEFLTNSEAKDAFESLSHTHLYGRHLVLEWADDDEDMVQLRKKASRSLAAANSNSVKRVRVEDYLNEKEFEPESD